MADDEQERPTMPPRHPSGVANGPESGSASLPTAEIERIVGKYIAERAGISAPYVHHFKWLWVQDKGPVAHVTVTPAPEHLSNLRRKP